MSDPHDSEPDTPTPSEEPLPRMAVVGGAFVLAGLVSLVGPLFIAIPGGALAVVGVILLIVSSRRKKSASAHPPVVTSSPLSTADELERLAKLHRDGALTDEEYAAAKRRALG